MIEDLDEVAIAKARMMFKKVHSRIPEAEVNAWTVETFLSKCGIMKNGGITRAAIILLGKYESAFKLRPAVAQVTWTRRDEKQEVVDYEHFTVPFILTVDEILSKIENLTMREMPGGTLFPDTIPSAKLFITALRIKTIRCNRESISWKIQLTFITPMQGVSFLARWRML